MFYSTRVEKRNIHFHLSVFNSCDFPSRLQKTFRGRKHPAPTVADYLFEGDVAIELAKLAHKLTGWQLRRNELIASPH